MSNLSGNYKISVGEVQGVDVVREQERRARLQLLDEIREPSPQPIFGEPVKVELEDETSRRIKNTLGDFTQVLINDSKNLLGIARSSSSTSGHGAPQSNRSQPANKRPPVNGSYKPSTPNIPKHPAPDKRLVYARNKPHEPPITIPPISFHNADSRLRDPTQWPNSHQRKPGAPPSLNGNSQIASYNSNSYNRVNPSFCPNSSIVPSHKSYPFQTVNGSVSNIVSHAPRYGESLSNAPPPKRIIFRPSTLKLPERKPEKPAESPIELETILREMKQAVPPPLTAIQTPRTEESGFAFPVEPPKEDVLLSRVKELKLIKTSEPVPQPPDPPKSKEINSRQSTPSPLKKPLTHVFNEPAAVDNMLGHKTNVGKELDIARLGPKVPQKMETKRAEPEVIELNSPLETEKATELLVRELSGQSWSDSYRAVGLLNDPDKCVSSSLQDDLEMSDSDDDAVTEIKIIPAACPKPPINTSNVIPNTSSTTANTSTMDVPKAVPSNSSSSESGDSDSDDSSSESNDSDSSASSEVSDADTPSKMWGLSNFFDESRRNHSPAFVPMDTSTNSSTAAVKEEPMVVPTNPKETYSLVDDDLGNGVLLDPLADPIPNFLELDTPVNIKNEILSPITSPLQPSGPSASKPLGPSASKPPGPSASKPPGPSASKLPGPSASQPPAIRGPRTPPSPSYPPKDESKEIKKSCISSGNVQTEASISIELTVPQSQTSKHSNVQQSSCDTKEDTGKVQIATARKLRLSKNKSETFSSRNESSPLTHTVEDDEPSASKGLYDASFNKDNVNIDINVMTSSCSVPSETSESSHENYSIKTRQKVSKSSNAKKAKILSEESPCDSGQIGNTSSKSPVSKFKHPTRTCRASVETKQLSKAVKAPAKSDSTEEVKKPLNKSDIKDKNSSEKTKITLKTVGNTKGLSKNSVKIKKKPQKVSPKQTLEGKKEEVKRKKNKFHIENFLQSPTISQSETGQLSKVSSVLSPSRDKSPIPDYKSSSDNKRKPSVSPSRASQSPSKLSTKSVEKGKNVEKLRRSARCSERASSIAQAESSVVFHQDTDLTKKSTKRTPKRREPSGSPAHIEAPPLLLSPIPHMSPIPTTSSECAIPDKIMVCIPLSKLSRLPIPMHALDTENKFVCKLQPTEESIQKKEGVLLEKSSKNTANKRAVLKDIKDKPRTDISSKGTKNKSTTVVKKDKSVKTVSTPLSTSLSKTASSVNNKTSIKTADGKPSWNSSEIKISKKRKSEDDKQLLRKKPKTYSEQSHDRNQHMPSRTESPNHTDTSSKSKGLERCDSVSSLSSLGSQMSQRSSKEKKSSSSVADAKRGKSLPVKHIKQEKEDKVKTTVKKEPGTPDKKEKSRDKLISKESDQKPLLEPLWSDTSSQYCPWDDPCKEDSKGTPIASTLLSSISRVCGFDWDHFGPEGKDMKEASNKHNNPLMPMDYYYTEGRKQRHLAEREKDPFLQTLKYFEATVLFILTSQQREEYTKEADSVYQFYRETLNFSNIILQNVRIQQSSPGSTEFKMLILVLRCQALLHVKLYNLKIKEIKEQQKTVADFFQTHCPATVKSLSHPTPLNPRLSLTSVPSPHSPTPSPASSVNSQTSGYSSSDISGNHMRNSLSLLSQSVNVTQSMLEMICRQHTHLTNLHMGHDLWEQADMYMTRSNLREFFKEVADQSENLTLHSSIKDLVNYVQTGISLVKKCSR